MSRASRILLGVAATLGAAASIAATSSASTSTSSGVATATARLAVISHSITKLALSTPLKSTPVRGKTVVVMECDNPGCVHNDAGIEAAAKMVHWNVKIIPFQFENPATLVSGMKTALQYHPVAVMVVGLAQATWASEIPAYKAAHVAIIAEGIAPIQLGSTVIASAGPAPADWDDYGKDLADWMTVDSHGQANALIENVPEVPSGGYAVAGVKSEFASLCPKCKASSVNVTLAQTGAGTANAVLVSAVRADPKIQYVVSEAGVWTDGLRSVLDAAGLTKVKIVGLQPDSQGYGELSSKSPNSGGWLDFSIRFSAMMAVDAALRFSEHMSIPSKGFYLGIQAAQLVDAQNIGSVSQARQTLGLPPNFNYLAAWGKLWKVSS